MTFVGALRHISKNSSPKQPFSTTLDKSFTRKGLGLSGQETHQALLKSAKNPWMSHPFLNHLNQKLLLSF